MNTITLSERKQPLFSDYCQFLLASFHNFTQTYFANHSEKWSHDQLNRLLREERISAGDLWRSVKNDIDFHPDGYLLFDDTVVAKPYAKRFNLSADNGAVRRSVSLKVSVSSRASMSIQRRLPIGSSITVFMTLTGMVKLNFSIFWICCEMLTSSNGSLFGRC